MKHHVLLGLMLGLLATARLGGQVPNLFNVVVNPSANTVTITPSAVAPLIPSANVPNLDSTTGITFLNFLPSTSTVSSLSYTEANTDTLISGLNASTNALFVYNYFGTSPEDASDPTRYSILGAAGDLGLNARDFFNAQSVTGTSFLDPAYDAYDSPLNPGKNLQLYSTATTIYDIVGVTPVTFFKPGVQVSLTITFGNGELTSTLSGGPYLVYAGRNSVNSNGGSNAEDTSLLGTYTITVVPEPSTYAAIAGGLGLVAAVLHRRRQRARASAA